MNRRIFIVVGLLTLSLSRVAYASSREHTPQTDVLTNGLVGYWTFDGADISGTTATDRSGQGNNGTLTNGPVRAIGKLGQALQFDGVDDYVTIANEANFDFERTNPFSVSVWLKPNLSDTSIQMVVTKTLDQGPYNGWHVITNWDGISGTDAGKFAFLLANDFDGGNQITVVSASDTKVNDGTWHHYAVTYSGSSTAAGVTLYEDGQALSMTAAVDSLSASILNNYVVAFGARSSGMPTNPSEYFTGLMDDVRVYNRALSAQEVTALYQLGAVKYHTPQTDVLTDGLVGYWTFDGPDISGTTATDRSGQGNTGTLTGANGLPVRAAGKLGQGLSFDGVDDYVARSIDSSSNLWMGTSDWTISAWVKFADPTGGANEGILGTWNGQDKYWYIRKDASTNKIKYRLAVSTNASDISDVTLGNAITDTGWHHILLTFDRDVTATLYQDGQATQTGSISNVNGKDITNSVSTQFNIGNIGSNLGGYYCKCSIDDVRVYNRALSAQEVTALYQLGSMKYHTAQTDVLTNGLVGYWPFDGPDISGTTAYDRSGQGNTGTLSGANGLPVRAAGRLGQGLSFDGVDDQVAVGTASSTALQYPMSVTAWIKPTAQGDVTPRPILSRDGNDPDRQFEFRLTAKLNFTVYPTGTSTAQEGFESNKVFGASDLNTWFFVGVTVTASRDVTLYIDGQQDGSGSITDGTIPNSAASTRIGGAARTSTWRFGGVIDDVRIYNRALSAQEIEALYQLGR